MKKKLTLNTVAVKSFVTTIDSTQQNTVRGGAKTVLNVCNTGANCPISGIRECTPYTLTC